jgi:hypothetical protein
MPAQQQESPSPTLEYASPRTPEAHVFVDSADGRLVVWTDQPRRGRGVFETFLAIGVIVMLVLGGMSLYAVFFLAFGGQDHFLAAVMLACFVLILLGWALWQMWKLLGVVTRVSVEGPLVTWSGLTLWSEWRGWCDAREFREVDVATLWRGTHALSMRRRHLQTMLIFVGCPEVDLRRAAEALRDALRNTNDAL